MNKNKLAGSLLAAAMALAAGFEGVRYVSYQDVGNVWTVCYGETLGVLWTGKGLVAYDPLLAHRHDRLVVHGQVGAGGTGQG